MVALHSGFLKRAVHALHLAVGPRVSRLGEAVFNAMFLTDAVKNMPTGVGLVGHITKLGTVVSQHLMYFVGKTASTRRKKSAAITFVARACSSAKATLLVRSMATNK